MGAGASAEGAATFDGMTKEEVADEVAGMGKAFEPYKEVALDNDIDGATLADLTDTDLEEIGVEKGLHRKKILAKIASPSKPDAATRSQPVSSTMGAGASATASDDWDDEKRLHATPGRGLPAMNAVESNALQTEVHKLVGLEKLTYWRNDKGEDGGRVFGGGAGGGVPVFISYATGNREIDDPGAGPGIEMCHAIVKALHAKGIPCWTGLHARAGENWEVYLDKLKQDKAKVLIVIQTQDFYKSRPCMKELFTAFDKKDPNLKVLPLRFELTVKGEDNPDKADKEAQWPNEEKDKPVLGEKKHENLPNNHDVFTKEDLKEWEDDKGKFATRRTLVQKELGNINSMPSRGVMSLDPAVEGMEGVSGIAGYVLEVLTEGMNAWEKKGYMARLKGMETRKNLDTREKADLDKKIYFSSGRNLMPYRDNGNKDTEVGFSAMLANTNIVIALLEEGGDPSGHGEMGNYAIHWAIGKQCDDCVFALIGGGADIQKKGFMIQSGLLVLGAFMGRRTPLDLALRPYGHGIIPRSAPLVNFLKERGAGCGCAKGDCEMGAECLSKLTEADNAQTPITDIEDEELKQWLVVLDDSYGNEVYNMFVKKRDTPADAAADYVEYVPINMQTLVTMATSAASTADLAAHLKNMLPDLASPACKKIAEKAAEDATKGKLSEIEIRIYDERMSAMKTGWMNPLNTAANLALQVSMAAVMAKNNDFTAAAFRLLFKGYAALGFC